jgi:hypothetical protein
MSTQPQWFTTTGSDGKVYTTQAASADEAKQKFAKVKQPQSQSQQPQQTASGGGASGSPPASPSSAASAQPPGIPKAYGFTPKNMAVNAYEGGKSVVKGTYDLGKDLVNNPNWLAGKDSTAQKFVFAPADAEYAKAKQAFADKRYSEAFGHGAASLIPFLGPMAAQVGEQAGTGDIGGATARGAGALATGAAMAKTASTVRELSDPKVLSDTLKTKAAELNTKVLKQATDTRSKGDPYKLSAGLQVAQEHIVGTMRELPGKIEQARMRKAAQVEQLAKVADQSGISVNVDQDLTPITREIATRLNAEGLLSEQAKGQMRALLNRITTETNMQTGQPQPRNLTTMSITSALKLTRGLEDLSAFGRDAPTAIEGLARRIRRAVNDRVEQQGPLGRQITKLRQQESRLITARDAAKDNFVNMLNEKSTTIKSVFRSNVPTIMSWLAMRASGMMAPVTALASVMVLKALAESAPSRTMRAALYARGADFIDSFTTGAGGPRGAAWPRTGQGGAAGPPGPRLPQGGPLTQQNKGVTGGMPGSGTAPTTPFASASVVSQNPAPEASTPVRGTELPSHATRARAGSGDYVRPPATSTAGSTEGAARDTAIMSQLAKEHPDWSLSRRLQEAAKIANPQGKPRGGNGAKSTTKNKAMLDRLDTLFERQAKPKSGADRVAITREIDEIKKVLSGEADPTEQSRIAKRIADRERLASKRSTAQSEASGGSVSASGEVVSQQSSPEQRAMVLDAGYKKLAEFDGGPDMVKALRSTAKAMSRIDPSYDEVHALIEALAVLNKVSGDLDTGKP